MPTDLSKYSGVLVAALLLWAIYRRLRRTFTRQRVSPARMGFRAAFLGVIGMLFVPLAFQSLPLAAAVLTGLAGGVLLAVWGAANTGFERDGKDLYYLPHTYSGMAVTALFLGRLAYRYLQGHGTMAPPEGQDAFGQMTAMYGRSPLTLSFFFVVVGYYVCYYGLLLYKARHLGDAAGGPAGTPVTGDSSKPA